jgi:hypothetical protein
MSGAGASGTPRGLGALHAGGRAPGGLPMPNRRRADSRRTPGGTPSAQAVSPPGALPCHDVRYPRGPSFCSGFQSACSIVVAPSWVAPGRCAAGSLRVSDITLVAVCAPDVSTLRVLSTGNGRVAPGAGAARANGARGDHPIDERRLTPQQRQELAAARDENGGSGSPLPHRSQTGPGRRSATGINEQPQLDRQVRAGGAAAHAPTVPPQNPPSTANQVPSTAGSQPFKSCRIAQVIRASGRRPRRTTVATVNTDGGPPDGSRRYRERTPALTPS